MTGRPWYSFYPDAYERDAGNLTYVQDSAYRRMLDQYYKTGEALPLDHGTIYRSCRAMRREERQAIDYCLGRFFDRRDDGYIHSGSCARRGYGQAPYGQCPPRRFPPNWKTTRLMVFSRDDHTCRYCGTRSLPLECDHIIPVSRGGSHNISNLATACKPCNRAKRAMLPEEWMAL